MNEEKISPNPADPDARVTEEHAVRRLLEAAAARAEDFPSQPPFLAHRACAVALGRLRDARIRQVGLFAWRLLPAFLAFAIVLSAWAGVETVRADREGESLVADLSGAQAAAGDVLFGAALLGEPPPEAEGGDL